jgi:beta-galactosidase GanA
MSTNVTEKKIVQPKEPHTFTAHYVFGSWMKEGGLEIVTERSSELKALVDEAIAEERARIAKERAELKAKSEAMEAKFAALGFPGGPPLDDAEEREAKRRGVGKRPTPPSDDDVFRKALVHRILTTERENPSGGGASTRGLARWSGADGHRIKGVLKDAPEVTNTIYDRWVAAKIAAGAPATTA